MRRAGHENSALQSEQLVSALAAAKAIGDEGCPLTALAALAPHLAPEQLGEALAAAKAIGNEMTAQGLWPRWPPISRRSSSARRSPPPRPSAMKMTAHGLWPRWPPISRRSSARLGEALAAAKAIGDGDAAHGLWPRWPPISRRSRLGEALAAAKAIGDDDARSRALAALAPHLAPEQGELARRSPPPRPSAMTMTAHGLWPRWPPISRRSSVGEALAAAKAIGDDDAARRGSGRAGPPSRAGAASARRSPPPRRSALTITAHRLWPRWPPISRRSSRRGARRRQGHRR